MKKLKTNIPPSRRKYRPSDLFQKILLLEKCKPFIILIRCADPRLVCSPHHDNTAPIGGK